MRTNGDGCDVIEQGTERVVIIASLGLIQRMQRNWSEPVQVKIGDRQPDGTFEMIFRTVDTTLARVP